MRSKKGIIIAILVLAIGFATVSTTLVLNGILGIGADTEDFQVYFSGAILERVDMTNEVIKNQGQEIIYNSSILNRAGQTSRLDYEVTNASTQYGADVTIECFLSDLDNHKINNHDYLEILDGYTNEMELEPGETKPGYVVVKLKKIINRK